MNPFTTVAVWLAFEAIKFLVQQILSKLLLEAIMKSKNLSKSSNVESPLLNNLVSFGEGTAVAAVSEWVVPGGVGLA